MYHNVLGQYFLLYLCTCKGIQVRGKASAQHNKQSLILHSPCTFLDSAKGKLGSAQAKTDRKQNKQNY